MTYKITKTTALDVRLIELSLSSAQTVSSGNTVAFDSVGQAGLNFVGYPSARILEV